MSFFASFFPTLKDEKKKKFCSSLFNELKKIFLSFFVPVLHAVESVESYSDEQTNTDANINKYQACAASDGYFFAVRNIVIKIEIG
jgi:hypothetical protein